MNEIPNAVVVNLTEAAKSAISSWTAWATSAVDRPPAAWTADACASEAVLVTRLAAGSAFEFAIGLLNGISAVAAADDPRRPPAAGRYKRAGDTEVDLRARPLRNDFGVELPANRLTFIPARLGQGETSFDVDVDGTGCKAGIYSGVAEAMIAGEVVETIPLSVDIR